jgi:hypothetical protein
MTDLRKNAFSVEYYAGYKDWKFRRRLWLPERSTSLNIWLKPFSVKFFVSLRNAWLPVTKEGLYRKLLCLSTEYRTGYNEARCAQKTSLSLSTEYGMDIMKQRVRSKLLCLSTEYRTGYDSISPQQDSLSLSVSAK